MWKQKALTWSARILSIISLGIILLFFIGEGFDPTVIKLKEWIGFIFFPFGISIGMILGWWKEGVGGVITVGSLLLFYLAHVLLNGRFPSGWAFFVFSIPGILFFLSWIKRRKITRPAA